MKKGIAVKINNEEEYNLAIEALDLARFRWFSCPEKNISSYKYEPDDRYICVDPTDNVIKKGGNMKDFRDEKIENLDTLRVENTAKTNGPEIYKLIERVAMASDIFDKEFFWRLTGGLGVDVRKTYVYVRLSPSEREGVNIDIHGVSEEDFIRILKMRPIEEARRAGVRAAFHGEWAVADIVTVKDEPSIGRFKNQMNTVTIFSEHYKENTPEWQRLKKAVDEFNESLERECEEK